MTEQDNKPEPGWLDFANPDLQSLRVTFEQVGELLRRKAPSAEWNLLAEVLVEERTPAELANMLIGACTLHVRYLVEQNPT